MRIKTKIEFSGVPEGTTGNAEVDHDATWSKKLVYKVTWDLDRSKPLVDWFDKDEFNRWLVII